MFQNSVLEVLGGAETHVQCRSENAAGEPIQPDRTNGANGGRNGYIAPGNVEESSAA